MSQVTVGCKLPHGLVLELPNVKHKVTLKGANSNTIVGLDGKVQRGTCGFTQVDEQFIGQWLKLYKGTTMVQKELIFVQKTQKDAQAQATEQKDQKTGFEPVNPEKPGAPGVTPAEKAE